MAEMGSGMFRTAAPCRQHQGRLKHEARDGLEREPVGGGLGLREICQGAVACQGKGGGRGDETACALGSKVR